MKKVNLAAAFASFSEAWSPRVGGEINDMQIKLAKFRGVFEWHHHQHEDELFLVVSGQMRMGLRNGDIIVNEGEFIIVPRGVDHRPEAVTEECHVILLEPASTLNTGIVVNERTVSNPRRLEGVDSSTVDMA